MSTLIVVRGFELLCFGLWAWGVVWVARMRNPVATGIYSASSTLMVFDWVFNSNWFFRVTYAQEFIPLWSIEGVVQPVALACNYAFFFGVPVLMLARARHTLDRKLGGWGYLAVFLLGALLDLAFEIPAVGLGLWTYHQAEPFLLGGVPYSNFWYSGLLFVASYGAARLALRWGEVPVAALVVSPTGGAVALDAREARLRGFLMGTASIWAAFYLCLSVQLLWYLVANPWVAGPRPF